MKLKYILPSLSLCALSFCACGNDLDYVSNDPNADSNAPACYDVNDLHFDYNIFFRPTNAWVGDPMPFYENGKFYVFYLQDERPAGSTFHPWYMATTSDFTSYQDKGEAIPCGEDKSQEDALGTGSVFKDGTTYYAFYTAHNGELDPKEKIYLATSTNLQTWNKQTSFSLEAPNGYDRNEFRDPIVFKERSNYKMLVSTRADVGGGAWKGVVAQFESNDLFNWSPDAANPFFYIDDEAFMVECPDVFIEGNYQYLIYSGIGDRLVHYKYRKTGTSNWITPANSALDGVAFYAAKTAADTNSRYLFGWIPTKGGYKDDGVYDWGGSLAVHRLTQNSDGTLNVTIAESLNNKFSNVTAIGTTELNASERQVKVFDRLPKSACKITAKIKAGTSTSFGISFGACGNLREVYDLVFDLSNSQLRMDKNIRGQSPSTLASVKLPVPANKEFDVTVITEGSVAVIYVNNQIALSTRSYRMNQNPWGIFSNSGSATFSDVKLSK